MEKGPVLLVPAQERPVDLLRGKRGGEREVPAGHPLGDRHDVRGDPLLLAGEHRSRPPEPRGHLVADEEDIVLTTGRTQRGERVGRQHLHAGRALHEGLDGDRGELGRVPGDEVDGGLDRSRVVEAGGPQHREAEGIEHVGAEPARAKEIDFTAAYVEIESTYLVPPGSPLKHADEVDRKGVRIIVPEKAAYELYLSRTIRNAELVKDKGGDLCFQRFVAEKFDALAGLRPRLMSDQKKLPGATIVEGRFTAVQQAAGVPKGRPNAAKYLAAFIEDVKASGLVAKAISDNQVVGLTISAPA